MNRFVSLIKEHRFVEAEEELNSAIPLIMEKKFFEMKKATAAKMCEQMGKSSPQKVRADIMEDEEDDDYLDIKHGPKVSVNGGPAMRSNERSPEQNVELNKIKQSAKSMMNGQNSSTQSLSSSKKKIVPVDSYSNTKGIENFEEETEELNEARIKLIRARIRGGKIQRRKKVSTVAGMTLRGGKLQRMSASERRRRKMGARKGKMKRRAKLSRSLMKRKRSLQKRKSLGL